MPDSHTTLACHSRPSGRALLRGTLLALLIAAAVAALPAVAQAADNDDFFDAVRANTPGTPLGSFSEAHDNVGATTQGGEDGAFTECAGVFYGATVWYWFFPHVKGRVHVTVVTSGGFNNPVASVIRWTGDGVSTANLIEGQCNGPIPGLNRTDVPINGYVDVAAGQQYAVQVGGAKSPNNAGGTADTGNYSVFVEYDPDSDGDGLFDSSDECDFEAGSAALGGCPDTDGDGIANKNDACGTLPGGPTFQGCPDNDKDGIPEGTQDKCPSLNPNRVNRNDRNRDGCPDTLKTDTFVSRSVAGTSNGIRFDKFILKKVPKGARVAVKCKLPGGGACGKLTVRRATAAAGAPVRAKAARNLKVRSITGRSLPYGTTITVRITAKYATGRFIRLKVVPSGTRLSERTFCMKPGSKKLRKKGCA